MQIKCKVRTCVLKERVTEPGMLMGSPDHITLITSASLALALCTAGQLASKLQNWPPTSTVCRTYHSNQKTLLLNQSECHHPLKNIPKHHG